MPDYTQKYNSIPNVMVPDNKMCCSTSDKNKLKVLCIHGYRQSGEVFRQKTGAFRKLVHQWAEFTYIDAPHKVMYVSDLNTEEIETTQTVDSGQYGWFFNRDDHTYRGTRDGGPAIGFEQSVELIEYLWENYGPFDGILGFSQGGCFAGLICALQKRNLFNFKFNFAMIISGFPSKCLPHLKYYEEVIDHVPSLHVFGRDDAIIPLGMSRALGKSFGESFVVIHDGGHYFPVKAAQRGEYERFFRLQYLLKQQNQPQL